MALNLDIEDAADSGDSGAADTGDADSGAADERKLTVQSFLRALRAVRGEAFTDSEERPFVSVWIGKRLETRTVNETVEWLAARLFDQLGAVASRHVKSETEAHLLAMAQQKPQAHRVYVRFARLGDMVYLDLAERDSSRAVEIDRDGWRIVESPPVRFIRYRETSALCAPIRGGSVADLWQIVNIPHELDRACVVAFLVGAIAGQPAALILTGAAGSAKTSALVALRSLIDPTPEARAAPPKKEEDLFINATRAGMLSFDNLSEIPSWLSDAFARFITGTANLTRTLYTNSGQTMLRARCPIVLNGIPDELIQRSDLVSRSLIVALSPPTVRLTESEANARRTALSPGILGGLCDAVACGLRSDAEIDRAKLPRLADFTQFAYRAAPAFGLSSDFMLDALRGNQESGAVIALDQEAIILIVKLYLRNQGEFRGTAAELHAALHKTAQANDLPGLPRAPNALMCRLRMIRPHLPTVGIDMSDSRTNRGRGLTLRLTTEEQKRQKDADDATMTR